MSFKTCALMIGALFTVPVMAANVLYTAQPCEIEAKAGSDYLGTFRVRSDTVVVHHGAWYCPEDPDDEGSLDVHGCDNVLTIDIPSSKLSCGNVANSTQVRIKKYDEDELPEVYVFRQPKTVKA